MVWLLTLRAAFFKVAVYSKPPGIEACRGIPLSGSVSSFPGGVRVVVNGESLTGECKSRAGNFAMFYRWLEANEFLAIRKDRHDSLLVLNVKLLGRFLTQTPRQTITEPKEQRKQSLQQRNTQSD